MTTTLYREKHVVARERAAWSAGVEWTLYHFGSAMLDASLAAARREHPEAAKKAYPLPTITRPRVVRINDKAWVDREWRFVDGSLQSRTTGQDMCGQTRPWVTNVQITAQRAIVDMLADLIANPNETVEDL